MTRVGGLVVALLVAATLSSTAQADPRPYSMTVCADPATQTPVGTLAAPIGWTVTTESWVAVKTDCQSTPNPNSGMQGTSVATTRPSPGGATFEFSVPADIGVAGADYYRYLHTENDYVGFLEADGTPVTMQSGTRDYCIGDPCTLGTPVAPFDPTNHVIFTAVKPAHELAFRIYGSTCNAPMGGCTPTTQTGNSTYRFFGGSLKLVDQVAPVFTRNPAGPALDATAPLSASKAVSFAATDKGGGLRKFVIAVDGQDAQSFDLDANGGQCREPYLTPIPCKLVDDETVSLDTTKLTDGAHRLDFRVEDVSGNAASYGPVAVTVANHVAPDRGAVNGTAASDRATLAVTYGGKARAALTRGYGSSTTVKGILRNDAGQPIANADVRVIETLDQVNAQPVDRGAARTDAKGAFDYRIPSGPSRTVRFVYRSHLNDTTDAGVYAVKLSVPARVRLTPKHKTVRRGGTVVLKGTLLGKPLPAGGKLVSLEARDNGRWREADTARTDKKGRFTVKYHFSKGARRATYPMRIRVRRDGSYPYAQGFSKTVKVTVR